MVKVNKSRKFPKNSSFKVFCLEPRLNLNFLKTMTAKLNAKEKRSKLVKRNSFVLGNLDTAVSSPKKRAQGPLVMKGVSPVRT